VLGRVDLIWGPRIVACVNGQVQFSRDSAGQSRTALTRNSVVCVGSGNDVVKVLAPGETQACSYYGLPLTMNAFQYGGFELAIYGQGGADQITGGDGFDQLCGGTGNDRIWGRNGINELNGGPGNDDIYGGPDIDYLYGADGDDIVSDAAGTGGSRMVCYAGGQNYAESRIEGGAGNDCLQVAPFETGWCYGQFEVCGGTVPCHGGIYCAAGYDRVDTPGSAGLGCEVVTNGLPCTR
jgi:Ca2+-binding RTX toxin-like protein